MSLGRASGGERVVPRADCEEKVAATRPARPAFASLATGCPGGRPSCIAWSALVLSWSSRGGSLS